MSPVGHRRTRWMNVSDLDTHRSNKREAFDGMRAYHQSELSQKNDCIEILKAILTVSLLAYGGLLAIVHGRQLDITSGEPGLSSSSPSPASRSLGRYCRATNAKIEQDNARYRKYQDEYKLERQALKLGRRSLECAVCVGVVRGRRQESNRLSPLEGHPSSLRPPHRRSSGGSPSCSPTGSPADPNRLRTRSSVTASGLPQPVPPPPNAAHVQRQPPQRRRFTPALRRHAQDLE